MKDSRPFVEDALLRRIKEACRKHQMYIVVKHENNEPFYIVYKKHPNPEVKAGIGLGRRSTLQGLRLHVNRLIPNEADCVR
jgi:molybdopterin-guanine dinucleotide biosynthesis protein A